MSTSYENIRLVIADPSPMVRSGLRAALYTWGFRTVIDTASFVRLHDLIEQDAIDLLITSSELEGNDVNYLVQEMRNQRLGSNPFPLVVILLASAEPDYVRRAIDSGADDLLLTPVVPDQLMVRVGKLTRTRKPFVITHDYTGPDRRSKARMFESHSAPMIEVPNPLKVRAQGTMDATRYLNAVRETATTLNRMKIERLAVQIEWLVNHIQASIRDGIGEPQELIIHTTRLVSVAEDMIRRMKHSPSEVFVGPVADLLELARKVDSNPTEVGYGTLENLHTLARQICRQLGNPPVSVPRRVG